MATSFLGLNDQLTDLSLSEALNINYICIKLGNGINIINTIALTFLFI